MPSASDDPQHFVCPHCVQAVGSDVVDSRATHQGALIRRRRQCHACRERFTTYEGLVDPTVLDDMLARARIYAGRLRVLAAALERW